MDKHEFGRALDQKMEDALDGVFDWANAVTVDYLKPSEVMNIIDGRWGFGDLWADWWQSDDEGEWS